MWLPIHTLVPFNSADEVVATMTAARVPCGPILTPADILKEEQYQQR
jgi:crotonobetainyl-CoA:carnitine CoA-transferase CaiB-like acyl-CoA transferase